MDDEYKEFYLPKPKIVSITTTARGQIGSHAPNVSITLKNREILGETPNTLTYKKPSGKRGRVLKHQIVYLEEE